MFDASADVLGSGLVLYPGADPGAEGVILEIERAVERFPHLAAVRNLGDEYLPVLKAADVLIGNSSSGIIEAASLHVPVVDVGERQRGRLRPPNVLHVTEEPAAIALGIRRALSAEMRSTMVNLVNPYGDGTASHRIVRAVLDAPLDRLMRKPLMELPAADPSLESLTVPPDATLRDALAAIDRGRSQIAFVTDGEKRLVGSISDGDVRRALLRGAALGDNLSGYMTRVPVVATPADGAAQVLEIMERNGVTQLPVVDEQGILVGVHLMRAIVGRALDQESPENGAGSAAQLLRKSELAP